jgi:nitrogen fixation protein NifU and related proteins
MKSADLSKPLGPLPPMKLHCGDMVEGALRDALRDDRDTTAAEPSPAPATNTNTNTLLGDMQQPALRSGKLKVIKL